jgi:hypothetical protein
VSIETTRKFVERWGVGCFAVLLMGFIASALFQGPGCARGARNENLDTSPVVAELGGFKATALQMDRLAAASRNSSDRTADTYGPADEANAYAGAVGNVMDHVATLELAAQNGIKMDDKKAQEAIPSLWAQQIQTFKDMLRQNGKLKPNATEQEFETAFKAQNGISVEDQHKDFVQQFDDALADAARHELILAEIANRSLAEKFNNGTTITDEDLKNSYNELSVKRIAFEGKAGAEGQKLAEKALADIKAGMSFDQAIRKYNTAKPPPGKKATNTTNIPNMLKQFPGYKELFELKDGEISRPMDQFNSTTIFQKVKTVQNLPKDFEKNKEQLRKDLRQQEGPQRLRAALDALKSQIKWKDEGYKLLFDLHEATGDFTASADVKKKKLLDIQSRAEKVAAGNGPSARLGALALFAANEEVYKNAKPEEQKAMAGDRIKAIEAALQGTESPNLRVELAQLYKDTGKTKEAIDQLKEASRGNNDTTSASGQKNYDTTLKILDELKAAKNISDADAKAIEAELKRWREQKQEQVKMEAEAKKQEAELRRQAEEQAKKDAAASKKATAGTTGAAPPTTTAGK